MSVISIVGARGGAGTSTLALEIARALKAEGSRIRLIDTDPWESVISDAGDFQALDPDHTIVATARYHSCEGSDHIVLLVPSEVRAIATAADLLEDLERHALVSLVVRTPGPTPIKPEKVSDLLRLPLAAVIKEEKKVAILGEHGGQTTRAFRQSVHHLLEALELE